LDFSLKGVGPSWIALSSLDFKKMESISFGGIPVNRLAEAVKSVVAFA
jgi:hypothetical protein